MLKSIEDTKASMMDLLKFLKNNIWLGGPPKGRFFQSETFCLNKIS